MTQEEVLARGEEAARLLKSEVLNAAIETVREAKVGTMIAGATPEEREEARSVILGLTEIVRALKVYADNAEMVRESMRRTQ